MKNRLWYLLLVTALMGCGEESDTTEVQVRSFSFDHYLKECSMTYSTACFQILEPTGVGSFEAFVVQGFEFEWGYQYELEIETTITPIPDYHKPAVNHRLLKLTSKEQITGTAPFLLKVGNPQELIKQLAAERFRVFDSKDFTCLSASDCNLLPELIEQGMSVQLEFYYADDKAEPLQLSKIKCFSTSEYFNVDCKD